MKNILILLYIFTLISCQQTNLIEHENISKNEKQESPFLFRGLPLSEDRQLVRLNELLRAERKYPSYESCVYESESFPPSLNWDKIRGTTETEICIFRVSSYLGNINSTKEWLESEGAYVGLTEVAKNLMQSYYNRDEQGFMLSAIWLEGGELPLHIPFYEKIFMKPKELAISIRFTEDSEIIHVQAGLIRK